MDNESLRKFNAAQAAYDNMVPDDFWDDRDYCCECGKLIDMCECCESCVHRDDADFLCSHKVKKSCESWE